ncbi:unnamed protein product, partial [Larinioides sclopetarius]
MASLESNQQAEDANRQDRESMEASRPHGGIDIRPPRGQPAGDNTAQTQRIRIIAPIAVQAVIRKMQARHGTVEQMRPDEIQEVPTTSSNSPTTLS